MTDAKGLVNRERVTNLLLDLCATDSGSKQERLMADKLTAILTDLGFTVHEDDAGAKVGGNAGNLYARLAGTPGHGGEPLVFSCHMDRVTPGLGIKPRIVDGAMVSDGTTILGADDAAGLAALLEAAQVLKEKSLPHPTLEFGLTICEEIGLVGASLLDFGWFTGKMGYALDAGGPVGQIVVQAPSSASVKAIFHGRASHAGVAPEKGVSAIQMAAKAIAGMKLLRVDHETTANIGSIKTEGPTNIVPDRCEIVGGARSLVAAKLEAQLAHMRQCMEDAAQECGGTVDVTIKQSYPAYDLDKNSPAVALAAKAAQLLGEPVEIASTGGGADANIFNGAGIAMAVLGVGYEEIHSTRERMPLDQLAKLAEWTLAIMQG